MKILKYLLIIILIVLIGGWALVATQPNDYDVKRSRLIKAPAEMVFNNLNDFKNWEAWGPWMEEDSTIVATYPKQTSGVGASYTWTSKDGPGNMKTVALVENKTLDQKLQFADYDPIDVYWTLEEKENGTLVTWGMKTDANPFMFKFFGLLSGGMDGMLGPMEEKGLENIENILLEEIKNMPPTSGSFRLGEITQKDIEAQSFIGYRQKASFEEVPALFAEFMPKAGAYAMSQNLAYGEFTPGAYYMDWDEEKGQTEFYIGILLHKKIEPGEGMDQIDIPAGRVVMLSKFGNYGTGDLEAHTSIFKYGVANSINFSNQWELYVNDPTSVSPEEIQTDIYYLIK